MIQLNQVQRVFFLGIGGIGMSAVARYFNHLGKEVFGYDRTKTELTEQLESEGMKIHYEDRVEMLPEEIDLVVWTPAISIKNEQLIHLKKIGARMMKRAEVLGLISKEKSVIAVAGTHGKTTTSIMLSYLLDELRGDVSAFLGGISANFGTNFLSGESNWVVMEADEYDRSFWQLHAQIIILTAMDPDHLDVYGDHEEMIRSYKVFVEQINPNGCLIYQYSLKKYFDADFLMRLKKRNIQMISYGVGAGEARSENKGVIDGFSMFDYHLDKWQLNNVKMRMPGKHNIENMTAALTAAYQVQEDDGYREIVSGFTGIERRFEVMRFKQGWQVVSDYAHHPEELEAAIEAARSYFKGRHLTGVFQPHLYSRTKDFAEGFAEALDKLDQPILVELYPAREEPIEGISSETITKKMKHKDVLLTTKKELINELNERDIDVLLILGAGDLDPIMRKFKIN